MNNRFYKVHQTVGDRACALRALHALRMYVCRIRFVSPTGRTIYGTSGNACRGQSIAFREQRRHGHRLKNSHKANHQNTEKRLTLSNSFQEAMDGLLAEICPV